MKRAIVIVSGGMDSVTLAYWFKERGYELHLLSFDYGQRHRKELHYAKLCADRLDAEYDVVSLAGMAHLLKGSALTDAIDVPEGHYAAESMNVTVVPNRNAVMLSIAYAVAVSEQAEVVAIGVHAGDYTVYPDCRPEFIQSFNAMENFATEGTAHPQIVLRAPFLHSTKAEIVQIGARLHVPFEQTWSCYNGEKVHCGRCGTCCERILSFIEVGILDPTEYVEGIKFALNAEKEYAKQKQKKGQ